MPLPEGRPPLFEGRASLSNTRTPRSEPRAPCLDAGSSVDGGPVSNFAFKAEALERRLMAERYISDGMVPQAGDVERLTRILSRPLGSYRDFAAALAG